MPSGMKTPGEGEAGGRDGGETPPRDRMPVAGVVKVSKASRKKSNALVDVKPSVADLKLWGNHQQQQQHLQQQQQQQQQQQPNDKRTREEIQRQNLLTLERLLLSPEGIAAAAALSGDVAAAAAALSSAAEVTQNPPTPAEAQVLRQ